MSAVPIPGKSYTPASIRRLKRDLSLGQRIKFARTQASLSHDRLGEMVGTSRQHLIRLEKGLHKPRPDMVARIAEATGVPSELLLDEDDEEADPWLQLLKVVQVLAERQGRVRA